jgi:DNA (cytosine-5)-methyltransferase 1
MRKNLSMVDLFAGAGGFTLGFIKANGKHRAFGFDIQLLVDIDNMAAFTFKKNFPKFRYWVADLNKIGGTDILSLLKIKQGSLDFLIGGPPCQGFSPSGKRWLEDNRNLLIKRFIRIALEVRPKCAIIENVPGALSAIPRIFNEEIQEAFSDYLVKVSILNAAEFGVPQIRKRAFIIAIRADLGIKDFEFPKGNFDAIENGVELHAEKKGNQRFISVEDAIGDLPPLKAGEIADGMKYPNNPLTDYQRDRRVGSIAIFNHVARSHSEEFLKKISIIKPGESNADLPGDQKFSENYYSQAYARLHPNGIGFTITAHFRNPGSGRFMHYRDNRSITVREAARLQSFDDRFIFHGYETDQERHVGNAVPPLLAESLANHLGKIIALVE